MTPTEFGRLHNAWPDLQGFLDRCPTMPVMWQALGQDTPIEGPTDIQRSVWLCWAYTRPGVATESVQAYIANQLLNQIKSANGVSVEKVLVGTTLRGIEPEEGMALDVIEETPDSPAMKTLKVVARVSGWTAKAGDARATASAWAWWWIGRSIAALPCPFGAA